MPYISNLIWIFSKMIPASGPRVWQNTDSRVKLLFCPTTCLWRGQGAMEGRKKCAQQPFIYLTHLSHVEKLLADEPSVYGIKTKVNKHFGKHCVLTHFLAELDERMPLSYLSDKYTYIWLPEWGYWLYLSSSDCWSNKTGMKIVDFLPPFTVELSNRGFSLQSVWTGGMITANNSTFNGHMDMWALNWDRLEKIWTYAFKSVSFTEIPTNSVTFSFPRELSSLCSD